jgi:hypothetical protein
MTNSIFLDWTPGRSPGAALSAPLQEKADACGQRRDPPLRGFCARVASSHRATALPRSVAELALLVSGHPRSREGERRTTSLSARQYRFAVMHPSTLAVAVMGPRAASRTAPATLAERISTIPAMAGTLAIGRRKAEIVWRGLVV